MGEAKPFVVIAANLVKALGVSFDYLVGNTELDLDKNTLKRIEEASKFSDKERNMYMCFWMHQGRSLASTSVMKTYLLSRWWPRWLGLSVLL